MSMSELNRQRSQRVRERYQQLEEQARPQRPVMVSSLRSFSYDMPTQHTEVERMMRARSESPAPAPMPSPIPLAESPPPLSKARVPVPSHPQIEQIEPFPLQGGFQQSDVLQQPEACKPDLLAEDCTESQQHDKGKEQHQPSQQLDIHPGQNVLPCKPLSSEQDVV